MSFVGGLCHASTIAFNGFESDTGDWSFTAAGVAGDGTGSITVTPSGTGPLDLTAFDGSSYATVQGNTNGFSPGLANGGSSFFGFDVSVPPYPGTAFTQQLTVYIDVTTPAPTDPSAPAFWIDTSPSSSSPADAASGGVGFGGEVNFRLTYTGSQVLVNANGTTPLGTITTSGWYTFQTVYGKGATDSDLGTATLNLIGTDGTTVLGSTTVLDNSNGDPLESQFLQGPGYEWLTEWQNGFSGDDLGIDDLEANTVSAPSTSVTPEPSSFLLLGSGLMMVAGAARRRLFS
jgi:hypothetical protein